VEVFGCGEILFHVLNWYSDLCAVAGFGRRATTGRCVEKIHNISLREEPGCPALAVVGSVEPVLKYRDRSIKLLYISGR